MRSIDREGRVIKRTAVADSLIGFVLVSYGVGCGVPGGPEGPPSALALSTRLSRAFVGGAPLALAIGVGIAGNAVLLGWLVDIPVIVQLRADWAPIPFNAGLCFALLGIGTAAVVHEDEVFHVPTLLAIVVAGISAATLLQHVTGVDLGVDHLFAPAALRPRIGRMPTETAGLFVAASLTTLAYSLQRRALYTVAGASILAGVGVVAVGGYAAGIEAAYAWSGLTEISFHTAACFAALGLAYLLALWNDGRSRDRLAPLEWIHVPIAFVVLTVLLSTWHWTVQQLLSTREFAVAAGEAAFVVALLGGAAAAVTMRMSVLAFARRVALDKAHRELTHTVHHLERALAEVKTLTGLLPICAWCKRVRDDSGYWNQVEEYVAKRTDAEFSHSVCPECEAMVTEEIREAKDDRLRGVLN